ncbi:HAMP domain-containing protein, partial [Spirochaetota bacterium]
MLKKKVKVPLRIKYALTAIILIVSLLTVSVSVIGYFIIERNKRIFSQSFMNDTVTLINFFSETILDGLKYNDEVMVLNTIEKVKKIENIAYTVLFDRNQLIVYPPGMSTDRFGDPRTIDKDIFIRKKTSIYPSFRPEVIRNKYFIAKSMYDKKGKYHGTLLVKYTTKKLTSLLADISKIMNRILIIFLILSCIVAVIFGFIQAMIIVKPILKIAEGVEIIGRGNYNYKIPVKRNDELGFLSDTFNAMTEKIHDAQLA